jgi:hypothetical protein
MAQTNEHFVILISSLASSCWINLGKIPNPVTNKVEINLDEAKIGIEMLRMLKEKTQNNLSEEEERTLISLISDLELNYADEVKKQQKQS